jgi:putative ABC transport system permease protein
MRDSLMQNFQAALWTLLGAVAFVLLIGCANIANLLMARSAARSKEFAVRAALGASKRRLTQQMLTESIVLGLAGGTLGLLIAYWGIQGILALLGKNLAVPRIERSA